MRDRRYGRGSHAADRGTLLLNSLLVVDTVVVSGILAAALRVLVVPVGFGIAFASWLFLALCAVLPSLALLRRIKVEEPEMARVLGEPYRAYSARTRRLIPWIW